VEEEEEVDQIQQVLALHLINNLVELVVLAHRQVVVLEELEDRGLGIRGEPQEEEEEEEHIQEEEEEQVGKEVEKDWLKLKEEKEQQE
jgi:hypothetical protein